jgi:predicted ribosomally synthesized peptide with nif11-like leader
MATQSSITDAERFLEDVDSKPDLRAELARSQAVVNFAKEHGYNFSNADLNQALKQKWGDPEKRKGQPDPFTCCCFSEPPGF